ncbi:beta-lactamase [Salinarchaeum sp. Harcht-Bsk1]|uniref:MBL fold metallo-hydrolase n=1 Tax=Salinarchaeum sp. Harcht-Bsk1 TaxID=1333523 RepID=UPI00034249DC|nr:MBL fold metallo-hydrolase [Salinarchaeum sp. Harcht-Bsk1]AGM99986.1 beta-lactamase [Salinarchaeum sp. Harcht-Bsk1]
MRVTFLGTGSAMPTGDRFQTGIVVEDGGERLLVDCGSGVLHRLQSDGPGYEAIDTVLLTHHHLDHVADLMPLIKARWLAGEEALTVAGPEGTEDLLEGLFDVHEYMQDRIDLTVRELDAGSATVGGFDVEARWTEHSLPCLAYRFDDRFAFSGDSEAFEALAEFLDGTAVVAHDCSFPDDVDVSNHATPAELGATLASADVDVGRIYLTHRYPHTDGREEEMLASLTEQYDVDARMAQDGLSVTIDQQ